MGNCMNLGGWCDARSRIRRQSSFSALAVMPGSPADVLVFNMRINRSLAICFLAVAAVPSAASTVVADPERVWPGRTIDVVICDAGTAELTARRACRAQRPRQGRTGDGPILPQEQAALVRQTLSRWNEQFADHIVLREVDDPSARNMIVFRASSRPSRCSTQGTGFSAAQRFKYVSIGADCNRGRAGYGTSSGTVAHEILHAIGFYHEQRRPGRARMLRVRAAGGKAAQWRELCDPQASPCRRTAEQAVTLGGYDFGSLMHYSIKRSVARPTRQGRERLDQQGLAVRRVGQRRWLTRGDIAGVRELYPKDR